MYVQDFYLFIYHLYFYIDNLIVDIEKKITKNFRTSFTCTW